ncbi:VpsF family polysaccharide biosynthesis protein [Spirosoma sp.]|uniref:VpsF family polysaccharide biosynthesis protein n=1 Tax=Spirosoma sp. TaxID=1899569 RepID=UPI00263657A7|nr:VpsF family polysaccharide biosynthesis protein [Spirosoma sp.]MCX6218963.1 VpsF family polysaccharide biosynthesis protein [Spirosoma sp.]
MRNLVRLLLLVSVIMALFLGTNVLRSLGYMMGEDSAPAWQKLFPALYPMVLVFILVLARSNFNTLYKRKTIEVHFLAFMLFFLAMLKFFNALSSISFIPNTILLPILFSISLDERDISNVLKIKRLLLTFFLINSSLAIVERLRNAHFFESNVENLDFFGFRSTALHDHPLNNAFITSIIMVFILFSTMKLHVRYAYYMLGYFSIICFGSRSSILICTLVLVIYFFKDLFSNVQVHKKLLTVLFMVVSVTAVSYALLYTSIGERLMNKLYMDESANVRLNVFDIFDMLDSSNLIWGNSSEAVEKFTSEIGIATIENFWIGWIIRFGLVVAPILIFFLVKFIAKLLATYPTISKSIITLALLGIASTNNSLSSNTIILSIFVLCSYAFNTQRKYRLVRVNVPIKTRRVDIDEQDPIPVLLTSFHS